MDPYGYQQPGYGSPYMGGPHMPPPQQQYYPQGPAPYAPYGGQMGYNQGGYGMGVCPKCGGTGYRMSKKDVILDKLDRIDDMLNEIAEQGDYTLATLTQRVQDKVEEIRELLD